MFCKNFVETKSPRLDTNVTGHHQGPQCSLGQDEEPTVKSMHKLLGQIH